MKNKIFSRFSFWEVVLILFGISILLIILQFYRAGSEFSLDINPNLWSQFGSFIGSFLLAATLLFQIRAFRRQQVEGKFFEMVKYYRENISEMKFKNPFYYQGGCNEDSREYEDKYVSGRRVIKTIFEQYKVGQKLAMEIIEEDQNCMEEAAIPDTVRAYCEKENVNIAEWQKFFVINELAHLLTYWGIPLDTDDELRKYISIVLKEEGLNAILDEAPKLVAVYEYSGDKLEYSGNLRSKISNKRELLKEVCSDGKVKFFGGHQYHLGHYFRHLYQSVKYIDRQPWWLFSEADKYDYVKTLRAQMSNYEQALLFINSLSALGRKWEYENIDNKKLISDYNLINNLPENFIPQMKPQHYYPDVNYEWDDLHTNINSKKKKLKESEFCKFLRQEDKREGETKYVVWARILKNSLQYIIGIGLFAFIAAEIGLVLFDVDYPDLGKIDDFFEMPVLQLVSTALAAATALELAYMLFTPGPDEAVQPVIMGIASFILYSLSQPRVGSEIIGIALLVLAIPILFWTKKEFFDKDRNETNL